MEERQLVKGRWKEKDQEVRFQGARRIKYQLDKPVSATLHHAADRGRLRCTEDQVYQSHDPQLGYD